MNKKDREYLLYETTWRLEKMFVLFGQVKELAPWLVPGLTHSQVRRTIARLRSGAIDVDDPRVPRHLLADLLEKSIVQDLLVREVAKDMDYLHQIDIDMEEWEE